MHYTIHALLLLFGCLGVDRNSVESPDTHGFDQRTRSDDVALFVNEDLACQLGGLASYRVLR